MAKGAPEGAKGVAEDAATTVLRLHVRASLGIGQACLGRWRYFLAPLGCGKLSTSRGTDKKKDK